MRNRGGGGGWDITKNYHAKNNWYNHMKNFIDRSPPVVIVNYLIKIFQLFTLCTNTIVQNYQSEGSKFKHCLFTTILFTKIRHHTLLFKQTEFLQGQIRSLGISACTVH